MGGNVKLNALYFGALGTYIVRYVMVANDVWWGNYDLKLRSVYSEEGRFSSRKARRDWSIFQSGNKSHEEDSDLVIRALVADRLQWYNFPSESVTRYDPRSTCLHLGKCCADEAYCHIDGRHFTTRDDGPVSLETVTGHGSLAITGEQSLKYATVLGKTNELVFPMDNMVLAGQAAVAGAFVQAISNVFGYTAEKAYQLVPLIGEKDQLRWLF